MLLGPLLMYEEYKLKLVINDALMLPPTQLLLEAIKLNKYGFLL